MKKIVIITGFILSCFQLNAQMNSPRIQEILKIVKAQKPIPRSIFLDQQDLPDLKLSYESNTRNVWVLKDRDKVAPEQVFDIRLQFKSRKKAMAFHQEYLKENSESGLLITEPKFSVKKVADFKVYRGVQQEKMMEAMGLKGFTAYCFLMVVKNYFVKVYVSCKVKYDYKQLEPLLKKIAQRIKDQ